MRTLVVDAANVIGSRPDGWWRDRAGAARRLHERLVAADLGYDEVVLVLEGKARAAGPEGIDGAVRTIHASGSGDDAVVAEVARLLERRPPPEVAVVTADRGLRDRVDADGVLIHGPGWLLDRLG